MKNNFRLGIIIFISILIPIVFQNIFKDVAQVDSTFMSVFWMAMNFLFISTIVELSSDYLKLFSLPGIKINSLNYAVQILVYAIFTVYINLYSIRTLYLTENKLLNTITSPYVLALLLLLFLVNLLSGLFPDKNESKDITVYTFSNKGSFRTGRDMLNVAGGSYDEGLVMGGLILPYSSIKSIYKDKEDNLIIKGKKETSYRVFVDSKKTIDFFENLLKKAASEGKIESKILRLEK